MHIPNQKANVLFNKLTVTSVENTSGIFIGTNVANGWRTYTKSNQGFGSMRDGSVSRAVCVVQDQDQIDFPVADVKRIIEPAIGGLRQQCAVAFRTLNAVALNSGSAIDIGESRQTAWSSIHKNNYGTGRLYGSNRLKQVANLIGDNDLIDAPIRNDSRIIETVIG